MRASIHRIQRVKMANNASIKTVGASNVLLSSVSETQTSLRIAFLSADYKNMKRNKRIQQRRQRSMQKQILHDQQLAADKEKSSNAKSGQYRFISQFYEYRDMMKKEEKDIVPFVIQAEERADENSERVRYAAAKAMTRHGRVSLDDFATEEHIVETNFSSLFAEPPPRKLLALKGDTTDYNGIYDYRFLNHFIKSSKHYQNYYFPAMKTADVEVNQGLDELAIIDMKRDRRVRRVVANVYMTMLVLSEFLTLSQRHRAEKKTLGPSKPRISFKHSRNDSRNLTVAVGGGTQQLVSPRAHTYDIHSWGVRRRMVPAKHKPLVIQENLAPKPIIQGVVPGLDSVQLKAPCEEILSRPPVETEASALKSAMELQSHHERKHEAPSSKEELLPEPPRPRTPVIDDHITVKDDLSEASSSQSLFVRTSRIGSARRLKLPKQTVDPGAPPESMFSRAARLARTSPLVTSFHRKDVPFKRDQAGHIETAPKPVMEDFLPEKYRALLGNNDPMIPKPPNTART